MSITPLGLRPHPFNEQLVVLDQKTTVVALSEPAAGGEAVAAFEPVDTNRGWYVDRITVSMPGAGVDCQAFVCLDDPRADNVIDGTEQGAFDVSENATPYVVESNRRLVVVWTGPDVFDGLVGRARMDLRVTARVGSFT